MAKLPKPAHNIYPDEIMYQQVNKKYVKSVITDIK